MKGLSLGCTPRLISAYSEQFQSAETFPSDRAYSPGDWKAKARSAVDNAALDARREGDAGCVEEYYRLMATEAAGERPISSRLLLHYLDGSGTPLGPRPEELSILPGIRAYQERQLVGILKQLDRSLPVGSPVAGTLNTEGSIDYDQDLLGYRVAYGPDLHTSLGHFGLAGSYVGRVVEREGKRAVELDVTWEVNDQYHWWKNNSEHESLRYLQEQGLAKEFDSSSRWTSRHEFPLE